MKIENSLMRVYISGKLSAFQAEDKSSILFIRFKTIKGFVVQLVEHTAHNGKNVSSILTKPNEESRIRTYVRKSNRFTVCHL